MAIIRKHGKVITKIIPAREDEKIGDSSIENFFGILPDFPDVSSKRHLDKENKKHFQKISGI